MNLKNLNKILEKEPDFRKKQIEKLIYQKAIEDWNNATELPLNLRKELSKKTSLKIKAKLVKSKDAEKALIRLNDNYQTETVLMKHNKGNTVCVSSQVGCALGCKFCATAKIGLKRNLETEEILEQVLLFKRNYKIRNVVFMGMGEPFLNYENVLSVIKIINSKNAFNIGARRISISTAGIVEGIEKLSNEKLKINLAISLHAGNNKLRERLMPISKKYPLELVLKTVNTYIKKTKRKVMFEYALMKNVNDSLKDAKELSKIMNHPLYMVNLIKYNDTKEFKAPSKERIKEFKDFLKNQGINTTERYRFGRDIWAGCGQLCLKK